MTPTATAPSYGKFSSIGEFEQLCQKLTADGLPFGFDIETSYDGEPREHAQLHPEENFVCGLSFTNSLAWARYAALRHDYGENLDNYRAAAAFWPVVQTGLGVAHNLKFELRGLSRWFLKHLSDHPLFGAAVRAARGYFPYRSCTLLESYAEARNRKHGLKEITLLNFGHRMAEIFDLFPARLTKKGEPRKMTKFEESSIRFSELDQDDPKVIAYACEDSVWSLAHHLRRYSLVKDSFIYQLEMNTLPVTVALEDEGVLYDWNYMREGAVLARAFAERLAVVINTELTRLVRQKLGPDQPPVQINLGSFKQLSEVLYDKLGFTTRRKTGAGKNSTDDVALTGLAKAYPVIQQILDWRSLVKLAGTYLEVYETRFSYAGDGRAHPSWIQHGVPAGRYACAEPPKQQSPKKYHYELPTGEVFDFNFRDAIAAPPGWYILGFDYKQQELRVLAGEAGETTLTEAFARGDDPYKLTASLMLGVPLEEVTKDQRDFGKTMSLALGYQMGVAGLADRLGCTKDEAQGRFDQFFIVYSRIKAWMERTVASSKALGYVTTRFGRVIRIWEYESNERYIYAEGERLAGNAPIQGAGTGDYTKIAMVRMRAALQQAGMEETVRLFSNMHDSLMFYVRDDVPPAEVIRVLQPAVVFPVEGWPPIEVEWYAGRRWGSVRELEVLPDGSVRVAGGEQPVAVPDAGPGPDAGHPGRDESLPEPVPEIPPPALPVPVLGAGGGASGEPAVRVPPGAAGGRTVVITAVAAPDRDTFFSLVRMLAQAPGSNTVRLRVPEGELRLPGLFAADPSWEPQVSMLLGGAMVTYDLDSVDTDKLAAGLDL